MVQFSLINLTLNKFSPYLYLLDTQHILHIIFCNTHACHFLQHDMPAIAHKSYAAFRLNCVLVQRFNKKLCNFWRKHCGMIQYVLFIVVEDSQIWPLRIRRSQILNGRRCAGYLSLKRFANFLRPCQSFMFYGIEKFMTWLKCPHGYVHVEKKNCISKFELVRFLWDFENSLNRA